jgi:hypothetical protein
MLTEEDVRRLLQQKTYATAMGITSPNGAG